MPKTQKSHLKTQNRYLIVTVNYETKNRNDFNIKLLIWRYLTFKCLRLFRETEIVLRTKKDSMKSIFKILFYLKKNEPKKNGNVTIMIRVTVDGSNTQFSSKIDIHPDNWDVSKGQAKTGKGYNTKNAALNHLLKSIKAELTVNYNRLMNVKGYALPEQIRNTFFGLEEKEKTLISYFTQFNDQYKQKVGTTTTQMTYSRYELTKQRLIDFIKDKYNRSDIQIHELNTVFIDILKKPLWN